MKLNLNYALGDLIWRGVRSVISPCTPFSCDPCNSQDVRASTVGSSFQARLVAEYCPCLGSRVALVPSSWVRLVPNTYHNLTILKTRGLVVPATLIPYHVFSMHASWGTIFETIELCRRLSGSCIVHDFPLVPTHVRDEMARPSHHSFREESRKIWRGARSNNCETRVVFVWRGETNAPL